MREKTNSITHLVKIVADEVFNEKTMVLTNRVFVCEKEIKILQETRNYNTDEFISSIQSSLEKAGRPWNEGEDDLLIQEVKTAIAQIAKNHSRSKGAVIERIKHRQIIFKGDI